MKNDRRRLGDTKNDSVRMPGRSTTDERMKQGTRQARHEQHQTERKPLKKQATSDAHKLRADGVACDFSGFMRTDFSHDVAPVHFHRAWGNRKNARNLFRGVAIRD